MEPSRIHQGVQLFSFFLPIMRSAAPGTLVATLAACTTSPLVQQRRAMDPIMAAAADDLFARYAADAPTRQAELFGACWDIVGRAVAATVPEATSDMSSFSGALEAFVAAGPDDPSALPEDQRAVIMKLSETAASYGLLVDDELSRGTRYRTLNRPLGAFFCGISLWPRTAVDVPNFTLYFGSGSQVNPDRVFMRLEMIPRVDTDTDAEYAEKYYAPFNERYFAFMRNEAFEPYVSDSAYARGALPPSGLRYFFDGTDENMQLVTDAVLELATQWRGFVDAAEELPAARMAAMAERDAVVRRVAAASSPDNANRQLVFGSSMFALTKALLSGDDVEA